MPPLLPPMPMPDPWSAAAWTVAVLAASGALLRGRRGGVEPLWVALALVPASLGQIGTFLGARRGGAGLADGGGDLLQTFAAFAAAVAPEAHGYLASGLALGAVAASGRGEGGRVGAALAGGAGVVGAVGVAALTGHGSGWLALLGLVAAGAVLVAALHRGPLAAAAAPLAVLLTWLGARHALLFATHHAALGGELVAVADRVGAQSAALDGVMIAGPGLTVAALMTAWIAGARRRWRPAEGFVAITGLLAVGGLGAVNTVGLAPLRGAVAGGRLPDPADLPRVTGAQVPRGACVAHPAEGRWTSTDRWTGGACAGDGALLVAAPADLPARALGAGPWTGAAATLQLLGASDRPAGPGPLSTLPWGTMSIEWVPEPLPVRFDLDVRLAEQLERWLDGHLGVQRPPHAVPGSVWVVDTAQGAMILMTGGGVTAGDPEEQRRILGELLRTGDLPRLVLVLGERWTVQDALDLCADGRAAGDVPCVWVRREAAER